MITSSLVALPARQASRKSSSQSDGFDSPPYLLMLVERRNHGGIWAVWIS